MKKKKGSMGKAAAVGAGIAAAGAVAYMLLGPNGKKNQVKVKKVVAKARVKGKAMMKGAMKKAVVGEKMLSRAIKKASMADKTIKKAMKKVAKKKK